MTISLMSVTLMTSSGMRARSSSKTSHSCRLTKNTSRSARQSSLKLMWWPLYWHGGSSGLRIPSERRAEGAHRRRGASAALGHARLRVVLARVATCKGAGAACAAARV